MKQTKFNALHRELNAKLVDFAGYEMPVYYTSIIAEHKSVRNSVGVFDVSHMGEVFIRGDRALDYVDRITVNDARKLFPGRVQYSAMCYPDGGIVDDLLVYCVSDREYLLVVNASNLEKDYAWMADNNREGVEISNESDEYSLLAVQGPRSTQVIESIFGHSVNLEYYHFQKDSFAGREVILSRTGYTGEIGYELYFKGDESYARELWKTVFERGRLFGIAPAGLGARDSLRLEMGFCLYGNDIDSSTNPLEAGLGWITRLNKTEFIGREALLKVKAEGMSRKLTPLISDEKIFPRPGYEIFAEGKPAGKVTSGTVSPILDKAIALAYIDAAALTSGAELSVSIRGKQTPMRIAKLPFVQK